MTARRLTPSALCLAAVACATLLVTGCDSSDPDAPPDGLVTSLTVTPNPSGRAPLTAAVALSTSEPVSVDVAVEGRGGSVLARRVGAWGVHATSPLNPS